MAGTLDFDQVWVNCPHCEMPTKINVYSDYNPKTGKTIQGICKDKENCNNCGKAITQEEHWKDLVILERV